MNRDKSKLIEFFFDKSRVFIILIWMFVNTCLLIRNGIIVNGEAGKYISEAHHLLQEGALTSSNFYLYSTQIFLITFSIKFNLGFLFVVVVQLLMNLVATFSAYSLQKYLFGTRLAFIGTVLLLFNVPYQEFNTFLQTESLFYSITLIFSSYVIRIEKFSLKNLAFITLWLAIIIITRPTGLLFLPATAIFLFLKFSANIGFAKKAVIIGAVGFLFFFILNMALGSGGEFDFLLPFRDENIICGVSMLQNAVRVENAATDNSIFGLLNYIVHHFSQFCRLAWLKSVAFFGLYRNYYSIIHNSYLIIYFNIIHLLILLGIGYWIRTLKLQMIYLCSIIFLTWITVVLTCDDWHNRFYLSVSPYLIILGLAGIKRLFAGTN